MIILAVDPGDTHSAYVRYVVGGPLLERGKVPNDEMRGIAANSHRPYDALAIEMIASYGMPVGAEVFETCVQIGRLVEIGERQRFDCVGRPAVALVYRRDVKLHLCGQARAKDGNVRQALIDRYGGKERAIGRKATPGPLFGISADVWQALAVAVTYADTQMGRAP